MYGSARPSALESLDRVQNAALRTCLGAFRTSPIPSLHVEAGELPLNLRRQQRSLQYVVKLRSNPAFQCVFNSGFSRLFEARPSVIATLGHRLQQSLLDCGIAFGNIAKYSTLQFPPWVLKAPEHQFSLSLLGSKSEVSPTLYETKVNEHLSDYDGFTRIFQTVQKLGRRLVLLPS